MKSSKFGLVLASVAIGMFGWNVLAGADESGKSDAFKPVASVHSLMVAQVDYFKGLGKLIDDPDAPKRMKDIHRKAEVLAELANVNTQNNKAADYQAWAASLRDDAMVIAKEAKKKGDADEAVFKAKFSSMKHTCGACHEVYQ